MSLLGTSTLDVIALISSSLSLPSPVQLCSFLSSMQFGLKTHFRQLHPNSVCLASKSRLFPLLQAIFPNFLLQRPKKEVSRRKGMRRIIRRNKKFLFLTHAVRSLNSVIVFIFFFPQQGLQYPTTQKQTYSSLISKTLPCVEWYAANYISLFIFSTCICGAVSYFSATMNSWLKIQ